MIACSLGSILYSFFIGRVDRVIFPLFYDGEQAMVNNRGGESCLVLGRGREVPTAHVGGRRTGTVPCQRRSPWQNGPLEETER